MGIKRKFCIKWGERTDLNFVPFFLFQLNTYVHYVSLVGKIEEIACKNAQC